MQTSTIIVLSCLLALVVVQAQPVSELSLAESLQQSELDTPVHDRSPRNKRGLLLLKKKLILGALGVKAAKVAGAAGLVGAIALKSKSKPKSVATQHTYYHHGPHPSVAVEVHRW